MFGLLTILVWAATKLDEPSRRFPRGAVAFSWSSTRRIGATPCSAISSASENRKARGGGYRATRANAYEDGATFLRAEGH